MVDALIKNDLNEKGERIEVVGDICLNLEFWDCECSGNYIHPLNQNECLICKSLQKDSPNSRDNEVKKNYSNNFNTKNSFV